VIEALPAIFAEHPNVVYIILGATHPNLLAREGESYRIKLERLSEDRCVTSNVIFYNRFVTIGELKEFIFDSFVRREQSKRQEDSFSLHSKLIFVKIRVDERDVRDAMRDDVDLFSRDAIDFLQETFASVGHHNEPSITFGSIIDCAHHALAARELHSNSFTNIRGIGGNAALTRNIIPKKSDVFYGSGYFHRS
jgi:hypothetical protein